jgi:hypothetical protein
VNQALTIIQRQIDSVTSELRLLLAQEQDMNDRTYSLLQAAVLDSIDLRNKVDLARGWHYADNNKQVSK